MEEASEYLLMVKETVNKYTNAIMICILSPVILIFLSGLAEDSVAGINENLAAGIGVITLILMVIAAVYMFLGISSKLKKYNFLDTEEIDTEYGVIGMVKDKKNSYEGEYTRKNSLGVILCIVSVLPLIMASFIGTKDYIVVSMVCVLLVIVSIGVKLIVSANIIMNSYDKLLQEKDYSIKAKKQNEKNGFLSGAYWLAVTGIYLGWSFLSNDWQSTWVVWAVSGVLYAVLSMLLKYITYDR